MKRPLLLVFLLAGFCTTMAQKQGNVWVFGNNAGLDFNSGMPVPIHTSLITIEGSASVCDTSGHLLFYTEGSTVWDRNGNPMPNGTNITGLILPGYSPTASTTQSSLIVPVPGSYTKFYLFSLTDGTIMGIHKLYYSVVDLSLNGGMGDIIAGQKGIGLDSGLAEKLTGVVGKCCNAWVVVNKGDGNFHAFEITDAGLNTMPVISPSGINNGFGYNYGEIKFSPDGNKMAAGSQQFFGLKLYDFDGYTGMFSNIRTIKHRDFYGICFSPDNSKLYAASDSLFQYDVTLIGIAGIINSEKNIAFVGTLTNVKRASNDKLYFFQANGLASIDQPNLSGTACSVVPDAVSLLGGTNSSFGGLSNEVVAIKHDTAAFTRTNVAVCFRDNAILEAPSPGCNYNWAGGTNGQSLTATASGNYVVYYHSPACVFHADTFALHLVSGLPTVGSYSGCFENHGAFLYIQPGAGDQFPYSFTWQDSAGVILQQHTSATGDTLAGITPGNYSVVMSGNGCDTTIYLSLQPAHNVALTFNTDTAVCLGDASTFTNTSNGFISYLWMFGDGDTSTVFSPQHVYTQPGIYHAGLIGFPCGDTAKMVVHVDSQAHVSFETDRAFYCQGESATFTPYYSVGTLDIIWNFGDGIIGNGFSPEHAYNATGNFVITATAQSRACKSVAFADTIAIYDHPEVNLGNDTFKCKTDNPLQLKNLAPQPRYYRNLWSTGDTSAAITVTTPSIYFLTVSNDHSCTTTDSIIIGNSCYLEIPNVFTPNGDGVNDYFFPRQLLSRELVSFHMQVYNRWGEKLFETDRLDGRGWDGKLNGQPQPEGVYVYQIEAQVRNGVEEKYQGNVTLLR